MNTKLFLIIITLTMLISPVTMQARRRTKANTVVKIHSAVVVKDLEVKPIPLTEFILVPDSIKQIPKDQLIGRAFDLRTDLAGWASLEVPRGDYQIMIKQPVIIGLKKYDWNLMVNATVPETVLVELTNLNAIISDAPDTTKPKRHISDEAALYQRLSTGVVTVQGEFGCGSGFLFDRRGLIMTNDHVVGTSHEIRVQFDEDNKYLAKLIGRDKKRDFAVLRIAPEICEKCSVLTLVDYKNQRPIAIEGEKVIALGSPLHQNKIMTSGIVSKVEKRAIITDVNINHGNSGGPLINLDGQVIAVNTFGDFTSEGGPGISGSMPISEAADLIARVNDTLPKTNSPSGMKLPVLPKEPYPLEALKLFAGQSKVDLTPYVIDIGDFRIEFLTPPIRYYLGYHGGIEVAGRKMNRDVNAGINEGERYDPLSDLKAWKEYLGAYQPIVIIEVMPKMGQTTASAWRNFLIGLSSGISGTNPNFLYEYEFKSDFSDMTVQKNGRVMIPIERIKFTNIQNVRGVNYLVRDVAYGGQWVFDSNFFAPNYDTLPKITLDIRSLTNTQKSIYVEVPPATVKQIWDDFAPYRYQQNMERKTKNNQ